MCELLTRVAAQLPQLKAGSVPRSVPAGAGEYSTSIVLLSPADDGAARSTFLRWIWYAARRAELHLDDADDDYSTRQRVEDALRTVVAPALRLTVAGSAGPAVLRTDRAVRRWRNRRVCGPGTRGG